MKSMNVKKVTSQQSHENSVRLEYIHISAFNHSVHVNGSYTTYLCECMTYAVMANCLIPVKIPFW